MSDPWGKFYWADWLADPKLKLCSLQAQGLWMRMLCIAAEAKPVGYVVLEGNTLGAEELAGEAGKPLDVVEAALAELRKWGVFSVDRHGRIYSRRMVKDAKKSKAARSIGAKGGNPKLMGGYNKPGFLYIMGPRADGAFKIGVSVNPVGRLKKVRAQYPGSDVRLVDSCPVVDMGTAESTLHRTLGGKTQGEWFKLTRATIEEIRENWRTHKGASKPQKPEARSQKIPPNPPPGGDEPEGFAKGWQTYPLEGRGNHGPDRAAAEWPQAVQRAGGVARLQAAIEAHAGQLRRTGGKAKTFDRWLRDGGFVAYLGGEAAPAQAEMSWHGPRSVVDLVANGLGSAAKAMSYLGRCTWQDMPARAVIAPDIWVRDKLMEAGLDRAGYEIIVREQAA